MLRNPALLILIIALAFLLMAAFPLPRFAAPLLPPWATSSSTNPTSVIQASTTASAPAASTQQDLGCAPSFQQFQTKVYEICLPQNWIASAGDPPDESHIALGPQDLIRPLIIISVASSSDISETKDLLLADTVIVERTTRQIAGTTAEQITFRALQGQTEEVLFFQKGELGFSILQMEGLEKENVDRAFEEVINSFRFRTGSR